MAAYPDQPKQQTRWTKAEVDALLKQHYKEPTPFDKLVSLDAMLALRRHDVMNARKELEYIEDRVIAMQTERNNLAEEIRQLTR